MLKPYDPGEYHDRADLSGFDRPLFWRVLT